MLYYLNSFDEAGRAVLLADHLPDLCASFQAAVVDMLMHGLRKAVRSTGAQHVAITGGVSANTALRAAAERLAAKEGFILYVPPLRYCMDNAAMIAVTGLKKLEAGYTSPLTLTAAPSLATL